MIVEKNTAVSFVPVIVLLGTLVATLIVKGADSILDLSPLLMGIASAVALVLGLTVLRRPVRLLRLGMLKSARQIIPAIPILLLIGTLSATWMLSGTVPLMIDFGLSILHPRFFLPAACAVCALVSVVTGSSWTTIATIGVAFMGIGTIMGFQPAWVAGAIISGAYFGDKISPLSDTTVLASSTCNVNIFTHIRYMMITTVPAMTIALIVFMLVGLNGSDGTAAAANDIIASLRNIFNMSPWLWTVPAITCLMIAFRLPTLVVLATGTVTGLAAMWIFQPTVTASLTEGGVSAVMASVKALLSSTSISTGNAMLDDLTATSGMAGMLPTIWLILSAMIFGGMMIGTGMLREITNTFVRPLRRPIHLVMATVSSGLFLNSSTGDQYISLVIGGNLYRPAYHRAGLRPELLSRSLEDSVSVTSVLIPWNSCGMTQSTVLGVSTIAYAPCCIFNILSPVMSVAMVWLTSRLRLSFATIGRRA